MKPSLFYDPQMSIRKNIKKQIEKISAPQDTVARCAISSQGQIVYANNAFYELTGQKSDDNTPLSIFDVFQFADERLVFLKELERIPSGTHQVLLQNKTASASFYFDWLTGADKTRYLIASATEEENETAPPKEVLKNVLKNIQSRTKKTEQTLRPWVISDLQDLLEFSSITHDVMIVSKPNGAIIRANETFYRNFGYTAQDLPELSFIDLFQQDDRAAIRTTLQSLVRENRDRIAEAINFESRITTKTGITRWVEWRQKLTNGLIFSSGRDITDIKTKHDDLLERQKQLSEAEAIGRMGHWRWITGEENITWSEEIFRIFGRNKENFIPTMDSLNAMIHPDDAERLMQVFQRAIIEEKDYDIEFRIERPSGEIRHILCEGRCKKDSDGDIVALYGIMQDMTDRLLYEQELRTARDAAQQAYNAKSRFLANMSHELRTPLNAIIGFSEIMESQILGPLGNDKYQEYAKDIHESGAHLLDLIGDILDMSKIEAGKYELDLSEVNLDNVIQRAAAMVRSRANQSDILLSIENIVRKDLKIIADRRAMVQIFLNILSNAVKFTPEGGKVTLSCQENKKDCIVKITDTGIGIPANKLASVLRPFEQVSSHYTRNHEGSGLGLSITKDLIELHGGDITLESEIGKGTTVSLRIPYEAKTASS